MKAVMLLGGYGTRLRPLTLSVIKPLIDFCNRPMLMHQIEALVKIGIKEIILALNLDSACLEKEIRRMCKAIIRTDNVEVHFSYEVQHLDTAGPLANAAARLENSNEPFFVLNCDIICAYPFEKMLAFHKSHGKEGTIVVTKVDEPSQFGAVVYNDQSGLINSFVEKPEDFICNRVNAGLYIFNPSILKRIELRPCAMETEIFPKMVKDCELYCLELSGFWMDVGLPKSYIQGMRFYLAHLYATKRLDLPSSSSFLGNVLIHPEAKIGLNCVIGPNVTIGAGVVIEDGVRIRNSAILTDVVVKSHAWIDQCIVGWRSVVGRWVRMENCTVLGEDVVVADEIALNGALVLPQNAVGESIFDPVVIM